MTAFSILLPTHNRPEVLHLAIRSVLAQTRTDWELLVVGDGCTDNTAQVVQGFDDRRIRWFDLPKAPGFGYANRNIALRQAKGDLVAFLGHDNLFFPDHLEKMAMAFDRPKVQFAVSRPLFIDDDGTILPFFANLTLPPVFREFMEVRNFLPATAIMHRRSVFAHVGMWPERAEGSGDWDLWKRILADSGRPGLAMVDHPTCLHFRANWRRETGWGPTPARWLRAVRDSDGWWPKGLNLELSPEALPQAQVWAKLCDQPNTVSQIREAVNRLRDHLAWTAGLDPAFR